MYSVLGLKAPIAAIFLLDVASGAAAQTIRYEQGGQQHTYDFQSAGTKDRGAKVRPVELPRGPKNLPWDEPGKLSGAPGVSDNTATDLPRRTLRQRRNQSGARSTASAGRRKELKATTRAEAERNPAEKSIEPAGGSRAHAETQQSSLPANTAPSHKREEEAKAAAADVAARTRLIEQLKAAALAEEQRRLESEKSRDRHHRSFGSRPPDPADVARAANSQREPEHTGTVAGGPRDATARPEASGWKQSICKMVLFGVGC